MPARDEAVNLYRIGFGEAELRGDGSKNAKYELMSNACCTNSLGVAHHFFQ